MGSPATSNAADHVEPLPIVRYESVEELEDYVCIILERRRIDGTEAYVGVVWQINDWRIHVLDRSHAERLEDVRYWLKERVDNWGLD